MNEAVRRIRMGVIAKDLTRIALDVAALGEQVGVIHARIISKHSESVVLKKEFDELLAQEAT